MKLTSSLPIRLSLYVLLSIFILATCWVMFIYFATGHSTSLNDLKKKNDRATTFQQPEDFPYVLIVFRLPEKQTYTDPTPHRTSPVALYQNNNQQLHLYKEQLLMRSTSTLYKPPLEEIIDEKKYDFTFRWGYQSVPYGIFTLSKITWKDGINTAFLISDWPQTDGIIHLKFPQTIYETTIGKTERLEEIPEISHQFLKKSDKKRGCALHPTHTKRWSAFDSKGCMNLYKPKDPDEKGDFKYDQFLEWFSDPAFTDKDFSKTICMVVVPGKDYLVGELKETVPDTLETTIFTQAKLLQGTNNDEESSYEIPE